MASEESYRKAMEVVTSSFELRAGAVVGETLTTAIAEALDEAREEGKRAERGLWMRECHSDAEKEREARLFQLWICELDRGYRAGLSNPAEGAFRIAKSDLAYFESNEGKE